MTLTREEKTDIMNEHGRSDADTGSPEVQVAMLTTRIQKLTRHLQSHGQDHASRRGLMQMVGRRRRLLNYLIREDIDRYRDLITQLGLRK